MSYRQLRPVIALLQYAASAVTSGIPIAAQHLLDTIEVMIRYAKGDGSFFPTDRLPPTNASERSRTDHCVLKEQAARPEACCARAQFVKGLPWK